jgi:signal transduction histidine kinase
MRPAGPRPYIPSMTTRSYPDAIDTRIVFRIYAIAAWVGGFALLGWGPHWYGTGAPCLPYGMAVPIRIASGMIMGAGCLARAMANVEDPEARHKALLWFAWGHLIVLAVLVMQLIGVWGEPGAGGRLAIGGLLATILILLYFWQTGDQHRAGEWLEFTSLFKPPQARPTIARLRSEYEDALREAAGQEERNRLARELHDSIKQQIFVIQTAGATAEARFGSDDAGARQAIAQVRSAARDAMIEMEVMLDQLRAAPLGNTGLVEALRKQCEALAFRTGAKVEFTPGALPPPEALPPRALQTVLRVAQEALANVARHARASRVRVTLGRLDTGALQLTVEDDGRGFDAERAPRGMGLSNMETRAAEAGGTAAVASREGGTTVTLSIPTLGTADASSPGAPSPACFCSPSSWI